MAATEQVRGDGQVATRRSIRAGRPSRTSWPAPATASLRGAGAYWYDASRGFFLSLPSHRLLTPDRADELRALLRHQPCAGRALSGAARWAGQAELPDRLRRPRLRDRRLERQRAQQGAPRPAPLRGGAGARSRRSPPQGLAADRDTLARQGRAVRLAGPALGSATGRRRRRRPGMEGWAAYVGGELAAFLVIGAVRRLRRVPAGALAQRLSRRLPEQRADLSRSRAGNARSTRACARSPSGSSRSSRSGRSISSSSAWAFAPRRCASGWSSTRCCAALLQPRAACARCGLPLGRARAARTRGFWRKAAGLVRFAEDGRRARRRQVGAA